MGDSVKKYYEMRQEKIDKDKQQNRLNNYR